MKLTRFRLLEYITKKTVHSMSRRLRMEAVWGPNKRKIKNSMGRLSEEDLENMGKKT